MVRKKVLFIHHCGTKSGAGNSLVTLIKHLDKAKYDCIVMCPIGSAFDEFEKVVPSVYAIPELPELVSISGYPNNYLRLLKALFLYGRLSEVIKKVNEIKPDLIHLNELSLTSLAKKLKQNGNIIIMHARLVLDYKTKLLNELIKKRINKYTDYVLCIDESVRHMLNGIKKTIVVYNSYQFKKLESRRPLINDKFIVLFLANLIRYKGVFDLVEASKQLKEFPDIEIQIAGGNSRPDVFFTSIKGKILSFLGFAKDNRKILQQKIKEYEVSSTVKLIGNISNIQEKIQQVAVNVFPSYMNGPSRSIFECGVMGVPSIISLHHKMNDVVENDVTGIIIDEASPLQIAQSILKLRNNKNQLMTMGENARRKYLQLNDPLSNAKKVEAIYDDLLSN